MSKLFLRSLLAGVVAAGVATAQTPPPRPLSPTSTPPAPAAPVQQVAFKQVLPQPAPAQPVAKPAEKMSAAVFSVADLVCPPPGSPLANLSDDAAMQAALKAYTEFRAEQVMKTVRSQVDRDSWTEHGGAGTLDFYATGMSLVVRNSPAVVARVGECVESLRKVQTSQVMVQMVLFTVPSGTESVKKLFDGKDSVAVKAETMTDLLRQLKQDGTVDVLSQPRLSLMNKQTGFFQVGQQVPVGAARPPGKNGEAVPTVQLANVGIVTRATPEVSADLKSVRLKLDVQLSEANRTAVDLGNGQKACSIDTQKIETTLVVPDGGTMALKVGKKKVEQRIETKVPVPGLERVPYVNRLFKNVGVSMMEMDTIAVVTVTRINGEAVERTAAVPPLAMPMPAPVMMPVAVAPTPAGTIRVLPTMPPKAIMIPPATGAASPLMPVAPATAPVAVPAPQYVLPPAKSYLPPALPPGALGVSDRVGQIVIVGNTSTMNRVILNQLDGLKPGAVLKYPCVEEARQNLIRLQLFENDPPPTVEVLPGERGNPFRDIRVTVKETKTGMVGLGPGVNSNFGMNGSGTVRQTLVAPPVVVREVTPALGVKEAVAFAVSHGCFGTTPPVPAFPAPPVVQRTVGRMGMSGSGSISATR